MTLTKNAITFSQQPLEWKKIQDLVGRPWVLHDMDCLTIVRIAGERLVGKIIGEYVYNDNWYDKGLDHFVTAWPDAADPVTEVRVGDIMLYKLHRKVVNHIAIYVGEQKILHSFQKVGSILSPIEKFNRFLVCAGRIK
tara:strand:+ start:91 stop:504 length:414 start_codon:yes stop_codon:yes gene_type:complete